MIDSLVHWFIGSLIDWFIHSFVSISILGSKYSMGLIHALIVTFAKTKTIVHHPNPLRTQSTSHHCPPLLSSYYFGTTVCYASQQPTPGELAAQKEKEASVVVAPSPPASVRQPRRLGFSLLDHVFFFGWLAGFSPSFFFFFRAAGLFLASSHLLRVIFTSRVPAVLLRGDLPVGS